MQTVLTDGGSEFQGESVKRIKRSSSIKHIPAECQHNIEQDLLFTDTEAFNNRLWQCPEWYNLHRSHADKGQKPLNRTMLRDTFLQLFRNLVQGSISYR